MVASPCSSPERCPSPQSSAPEKVERHEKKKGLMTLESERDLSQFLRVVNPDWSKRHKKGNNGVQRVIEKLKDINVNNISDLMHRVHANTINEDLLEAGHNRFSRETITSMRNQASFIRALDCLKEPYFRQTGTFAPVPQLFAATNLRQKKNICSKGNGGPEMRRGESYHKSPNCSRPNSMGRVGFSGSNFFVEGHPNPTTRPHTVDGVGGLREDDLSGGNSINTGFSNTDDSLSPEGFAGLFASSSASESSIGRKNLGLRRTMPRRKKPAVVSPPEGNQAESCSMSMPDFLAISGTRTQETTEECRPMSTGSDHTGSVGLSGSRCQSRGSRRVERCGSAASSLWGLGETRGTSISGMDDCDSEGATSQAAPFFDEWTKAEDQIKTEPWVAKWGSGRSLLRSGGHMLREQRALESKKSIIRNMDLEGNASPLRQHVASQIKNRLKEEKDRDPQTNLDFHQRCTNISNNLRHMQAARRDLSEQRKKLHDLIHGPEVKPIQSTLIGLSSDMFLDSRKASMMNFM